MVITSFRETIKGSRVVSTIKFKGGIKFRFIDTGNARMICEGKNVRHTSKRIFNSLLSIADKHMDDDYVYERLSGFVNKG